MLSSWVTCPNRRRRQVAARGLSDEPCTVPTAPEQVAIRGGKSYKYVDEIRGR